MYHPLVVEHRQATLERGFAEILPEGLQRIPVETCHSLRKDLDALWDPEERRPRRPFSRRSTASCSTNS